MNWKALTKTARRTLSRNSSKILLGLGIAGAFTAVGFAITATPKAMILLDEKKKELGVEKLDAKTIVKTAAPVYIPTAISMAVSTGCIIGASSVNDRRNAALAAAYTMSETALRSYQDKNWMLSRPIFLILRVARTRHFGISAKASRCCRRPITSSAYMMKRKRTMVAQSRTRPQRLTAFPVTPST